MDRGTVLKIILVFSVIGIGVAGYQTYEHYYLDSAICDLSSTFSCSAVTGSEYGEFPPASGIATAFLGMLWWAGVIFLTNDLRGGEKRYDNEEFYLFSWLGFGILFMLYLLTVELYILPQQTGELIICPFCTVQHVLMVLVFLVSFKLLEKPLGEYLEDVFYMEVEEESGEEV